METATKFIAPADVTLEAVLDICTCITTKDGKVFRYIPYWFEESNDDYIMHGLDSLPEELESVIKEKIGE